jgi:parallel beta-helix repeat protein
MAKAFEEIYIRADGSVEGTDKIQRDGDTYTFIGDINGSVYVEKSNIIIDGNGNSLCREDMNMSSPGRGFNLYSVCNVTILDTNIENFVDGIILSNSSHCCISGNNITTNSIGIRDEGSFNRIVNNTIANNSIGLHLFDSNGTIIGNTITGNKNGFLFPASSSMALKNNTLTDNKYGFALMPVVRVIPPYIAPYFLIDIDTSNTVNGKPVYYWISEKNRTVPSDAGWVALINCTCIMVKNLNLTKNEQGILLAFTENSTIIQNNITSNGWGISLQYSSGNSIIENTIANNDFSSIEEFAGSNTIIFHNTFIGKGSKPGLYSLAKLDNGYPSGGNYWSDYNGTDSNSDGIGDFPYVIDEDNVDRYPLMGAFSSFNVTEELSVQTICNSSITDFQYNGTAISFNLTGVDGTVGFCRICIPTALMNESYKIFINGTETQYQLLPFSTSTHKYLYFNYTHPTQKVIIIPEFPSSIILPLLMIATLLAVIAHKRKHALTPDNG